jgi:imidazolonepropionase-like amidohydrolase
MHAMLLVTTAIVGATVVHPSGASLRDATVVIEGDRIRTVGPSKTTKVPAGATVVAARGKWIIPGLIDAHVHFFQSANPYTRPDTLNLTKHLPYADEVARNKARLPATFKVWLASGVTGVCDVGGPMWNFAVRDAAASAEAAPRVAVAGPLISMIERKVLELDDPPIIEVKTVDEARALAKRELARHPDFVKVWFIHRPGTDLAAQEKIVAAAAEVTHAAKVRLAVHATELDTAKAALRAGADILVHSVSDKPVDDDFIALAKKNRVIYVPTLFVGRGYALTFLGTWKPTPAEERLADPQILATMGDVAKLPAEERNPIQAAAAAQESAARAKRQVQAANLKTVWDAGITVAMGTDAGNIGTLHGPSVFRELELMSQAGLTPQEVLQAATQNGAKVLGLPSDLGDVAAGKLADLVILDGDPLADVANLSRVWRVVKAGRTFDPDALIRSIR